jgi:methyl-accepting chemotaxis protein
MFAAKDKILYEHGLVASGDIGNFSANFQKIKSDYLDIALDSAKNNEIISAIRNHLEKAEQSQIEYEKTLISVEDKVLYRKWTDSYSIFKDDVNKLISLLQANKFKESKSLINGNLKLSAANLNDLSDQILEYNVKEGRMISAENSKMSDQIIFFIYMILLSGAILSVLVGLIISANIHGIVKQVQVEIQKLVDAIKAGKLSTRADINKFDYQLRSIPEGLNQTLDAVIIPMNSAVSYVDKISKGEMPEKITLTCYGDFNVNKNILNHCIDSLEGLVEITKVLHIMSDNDFTTKVEGKYEGIYQLAANSVNIVIDRINHITKVFNNLSNGDLSDLEDLKKTGKRSQNDNLIPSSIKMIEAIKNMEDDANMLADAAVEGKLSTRADATRHSGEFRKIIEGLNNILETIVVPLNFAAGYIDKISKGDIPEKITDSYKGDFNIIVKNLNQCIDGLEGLVEASKVLQKMSVNDYSTKVEGKYQGIYLQTGTTVNLVRDRILHLTDIVKNISIGDLRDLEDLKKSGKRSDKDILVPSFIQLMETLNDVIAKAKLMAQGDLTIELKMRSEEDELIKALTDMIKSVGDVVVQVQNAADNISEASQEMSSNSQQVSQGATEQASSSEEISSSMEEMSSNIQQNTDNAQQTEGISVNAAGGMEKVSKASQESLKSIKEIANKISIISDIAFQTNILALNAAVEAARAGEHGRGFAVVAAEVRKLAERSKVAAEEIDVLSKTSVEVTESSEKMIQTIIPDIEKTAKLVQEITAASVEQNSGANQINNAINQLNQVTQQNAAAAEEMATSSEELSSQADQLKELVGFFKVNNDTLTKSKGSNTAGRKNFAAVPSHNMVKPVQQRTVQNVNLSHNVTAAKPKGVDIDLKSVKEGKSPENGKSITFEKF